MRPSIILYVIWSMFLYVFLNVVNYVSKFVPNKSHVLESLNSLLKNNVQYSLNNRKERSMNLKNY